MKILGFILVVICTYGIGKLFSERECHKAMLCEEICDFLEFLSQGVLKRLCVDDIIKRYCEENKTFLFRAKNKKELILLLDKARLGVDCEKLTGKTAAFLSELGKSCDVAAEHEKCIQMLHEAREISGKCIIECEKKNGLYKKLGLICGITVCIIFV